MPGPELVGRHAMGEHPTVEHVTREETRSIEHPHVVVLEEMLHEAVDVTVLVGVVPEADGVQEVVLVAWAARLEHGDGSLARLHG
jgi:hypothetical protein